MKSKQTKSLNQGAKFEKIEPLAAPINLASSALNSAVLFVNNELFSWNLSKEGVGKNIQVSCGSEAIELWQGYYSSY